MTMGSQDYRYMLIRYVADRERMEPINVGVILQGAGRIDVRFNKSAANRKVIDTAIFKQWRQFFEDEICGRPTSLFQPEKTSPEFLRYLEGLCEGSIILSRPLALSLQGHRRFEDTLESLYRRLVAPPEVTSTAAAIRPTGRFRQIAEERRFLSRGMKKHAHIQIGVDRLWTAYGQVDNGEHIAFDKVEVNNQISRTVNEIERLPLIVGRLPQFLESQRAGKPTCYSLLVDDLSEPFTHQTLEEFAAMRDDLDRAVEQVAQAGGHVLRSPREVERFADELDRKLPSNPR
jgi:hypothetical protein